MATIEDLPKELLLEIFSHYIRSEGHVAFLRNIPLVCKRWSELSSDSSLWRDVIAHDRKFLLNVSRRGFLYYTQSLNFVSYGYEEISSDDLSAVLKTIRDLKALDFEFNLISSDAIKLVTEHCPHLERLCLTIPECGNTMSHEWNQFLTVCGATLKSLDLRYLGSEEAGQQLVTRIAAKCPILERLETTFNDALFPICELRSGCPMLRELDLSYCSLITAGRNDFLGCGFKDLKKFEADCCDFSGLDIYHLLKDSMDLEHLELYLNDDLLLDDILKLPSDKVRILKIEPSDPEKDLKLLGDVVGKWRHTLSVLNVWSWNCDISSVLKCLLHNNSNPRLESLSITADIDPHFLEEFIQKCPNLIRLNIDGEEFKGRERVIEAAEFLMKGLAYITPNTMDIDQASLN